MRTAWFNCSDDRAVTRTPGVHSARQRRLRRAHTRPARSLLYKLTRDVPWSMQYMSTFDSGAIQCANHATNGHPVICTNFRTDGRPNTGTVCKADRHPHDPVSDCGPNHGPNYGRANTCPDRRAQHARADVDSNIDGSAHHSCTDLPSNWQPHCSGCCNQCPRHESYPNRCSITHGHLGADCIHITGTFCGHHNPLTQRCAHDGTALRRRDHYPHSTAHRTGSVPRTG
jgi:hypothetical protein